MGKAQNLSYPAQLVHDHDRQRFLQGLFVPEPARETVYAVLALDVELQHIRRHVSEEMLGHIRYAWWEESLAMIGEGEKPREHPVLMALVPIIEQGIVPGALFMQLAEIYRTHYPELPPENTIIHEIASIVVCSLAPQAQHVWSRAGNTIAKHRRQHGEGENHWLAFKLLWLGVRP
jgi:hypothetical protein